jgi:hypothetical protein
VRGEDVEVDVPPRVRTWLDVPGNRDLLRAMWEVVGFFPVPEDAIRIGQGKSNPLVVENVFKQLLM